MSYPKTSTIKRLFGTSGNVCAYPQCKTPLVENENVTGEICHIKGHRPESARYDPGQKDGERHSFNNLILLCPTHHSIIDKDEKTFTVEKILEWKITEPQNSVEINDELIKQLISHSSEIEAKRAEIISLESTIREREKLLLQFQLDSSSPNAIPSLITWIDDLKKDISQLKRRVNKLEPERYSNNEIAPPTSFHGLPQAAFFTGREAYVENVMNGLSFEERTWLVSIDGLGGIGKTALATYCTYLCKDQRIFDEIIWVTAKQRQLSISGIMDTSPSLIEFSDLLDEITRAFKFSTVDEYSVAEKSRIVKKLLEQRKCLIVIDNLETIPDIRAIASFLRQTPHPTKSIVTSRRLFEVGEGERFIRLPNISASESRKIIKHTCRDKNVKLSDLEVNLLTNFCNGIPIALVWSIGRMAVTSPRLVLDNLRNSRETADLTEFCFKSSFETLQIQNAEAARAFLILSMFSFPITYEILKDIFLSHNIFNFAEVLKELRLLSLITQSETHIGTLPIVRYFAENGLKRKEVINEQVIRETLSKIYVNNDGQVHVFSPINDPIKLPIGATPVDYAYKIHTTVGNQFVSATVNGIEVAPNYCLQNGDQIEILFHPLSQGPDLANATTERAKRVIRNRNRTSVYFTQHVKNPHVTRGNTSSLNGDLNESIQEFSLALSINPKLIWAQNRRGHSYRLLGDLKSALLDHQTVLTIAKENYFAHCGIGLLNYQRGWLSDAEECFRRAINGKPDYINAMSGLGRTLCRLRDFIRAESVFQEAIKLSAQHRNRTPWLHLYLFITLINQGRNKFKEAEQSLSKALKQFSKKVENSRKIVDLRNRNRQLGTHTLYLYTLALILGNSPNYLNVFKEALNTCVAPGLKEEIKADLDMVTCEAWDQWIDHTVHVTSNSALGIKQSDLIYCIMKEMIKF